MLIGMEIQPQLTGRFLRYKIVHDGRCVCCFNPCKSEDSADFVQRRPSIHPLYTPAGLPVTEQGAHNYPHHKGLWIAHGRVDDTNVYADAHVAHLGRIITHECPTRVTADGAAIIDASLYWQSEKHETLLEERRTHVIRVRKPMTIVRVTSTLSTPRDSVEIHADKHGYFHARVIDAMDEDDGAKLLADNGKDTAEAIFQTKGRWIDCRGRIGPNACGVLVGAHPDEPLHPLFARSYGTIAVHPFMMESRTIRRGEEVRHEFACVAYDGHDVAPADIYRAAFADKA